MLEAKQILAEKIKQYRKEQELNQYDFADECGISRTLLSLIETGKENITINTMDLLAVCMGIPLSDIFKNTLIRYCTISSKIYIEDEEYTTYGIVVIKEDIVVDYILDISTDFNEVRELVKLCNKEGLELIHLKDVVEDAIC